MLPLEYDLFLEQGSDFSEEFTLYNDDGTPLDLTNAVITAQFARSFTTSVRYEFEINLDADLNNRFYLYMSGNDVAQIRPDRYWWNGFYSIDGVNTKFCKGIVVVNGSVNNA